MKKTVKGATKAKTTTKRTVKGKSTMKAKGGGFVLPIAPALAKQLTKFAANDTSFRGASPEKYANFIIKNHIAKGAVVEKT